MRSLILLAITFLLGAPTLPAQSMAEAAKKEKDRREKLAEEAQSEVVTEEDLESVDGDLANDPDAEPVVERRTDSTGEWERRHRAKDETRWRAHARRARSKIESTRETLAEAEGAHIPPGEVWICSKTGEVVNSVGMLRERVEKLERALAEAEADLAQLHEDARRERVPPGWLRER